MRENRGGIRWCAGDCRCSEKLKAISRQIVKKHTHHIVHPGRFSPARNNPRRPPTSVGGVAAHCVSSKRVARGTGHRLYNFVPRTPCNMLNIQSSTLHVWLSKPTTRVKASRCVLTQKLKRSSNRPSNFDSLTRLPRNFENFHLRKFRQFRIRTLMNIGIVYFFETTRSVIFPV